MNYLLVVLACYCQLLLPDRYYLQLDSLLFAAGYYLLQGNLVKEHFSITMYCYVAAVELESTTTFPGKQIFYFPVKIKIHIVS